LFFGTQKKGCSKVVVADTALYLLFNAVGRVK